MNGKALRRLRGDLTQAEFATKIQRDQSTISKYESGKKPIPPDFILLLRGAGLLPDRKRA